MKKILFTLLVFSSFTLIAACGSEEPTEEVQQPAEEETTIENETGSEETTEEESEEDTAEEVAGNGWETQVGDVVENEGGTFTLISRQDQIDTIETGSMILNIPQVNATSAKVKGEVAEMLETEALEYIQIDMEAENTSEDTINFYPSQATITTNTGEQLEADMILSDHIGGEFIGAVKKTGTQFFLLENSKAEDIEWVRILISAPSDENFENVGEEIDIKVEL